jgi:hypothetical protein
LHSEKSTCSPLLRQRSWGRAALEREERRTKANRIRIGSANMISFFDFIDFIIVLIQLSLFLPFWAEKNKVKKLKK